MPNSQDTYPTFAQYQQWFHRWICTPGAKSKDNFLNGDYHRDEIMEENGYDEELVMELSKYIITMDSQSSDTDPNNTQHPYIYFMCGPEYLNPIMEMVCYAVEMNDGRVCHKNRLMEKILSDNMERLGYPIVNLTMDDAVDYPGGFVQDGRRYYTNHREMSYVEDYVTIDHVDIFKNLPERMCTGIIVGDKEINMDKMMNDLIDVCEKVDEDMKFILK